MLAASDNRQLSPNLFSYVVTTRSGTASMSAQNRTWTGIPLALPVRISTYTRHWSQKNVSPTGMAPQQPKGPAIITKTARMMVPAAYLYVPIYMYPMNLPESTPGLLATLAFEAETCAAASPRTGTSTWSRSLTSPPALSLLLFSV